MGMNQLYALASMLAGGFSLFTGEVLANEAPPGCVENKSPVVVTSCQPDGADGPVYFRSPPGEILWVGFQHQVAELTSTLEVVGNGAPEVTFYRDPATDAQATLVVRYYNVDIAQRWLLPLTTGEFPGAIQNVNFTYEHRILDIRIVLRDLVAMTYHQDLASLVIDFPIPERYIGEGSLKASREATIRKARVAGARGTSPDRRVVAPFREDIATLRTLDPQALDVSQLELWSEPFGKQPTTGQVPLEVGAKLQGMILGPSVYFNAVAAEQDDNQQDDFDQDDQQENFDNQQAQQNFNDQDSQSNQDQDDGDFDFDDDQQEIQDQQFEAENQNFSDQQVEPDPIQQTADDFGSAPVQQAEEESEVFSGGYIDTVGGDQTNSSEPSPSEGPGQKAPDDGLLEASEAPEMVGSESSEEPKPPSVFQPVSIEFRGAPLREVIRTLTSESDVNFIFTDEVGDQRVDVAMKGVPWDEALHAILSTYGLGLKKIGDKVIRIDQTINLEESTTTAQQIFQQAILAKPTEVMVMRLGYSKVEEMKPIVEQLLTSAKFDPRVKVEAEARTNSLIIEAVAEELAKVRALLSRVDLQTPQVKIETRVIEVIKNIDKFFGINWGTPVAWNAGRSLGFGNLVFPNSLTSAFSIDSGIDDQVLGGRMGMHLGSINNVFELDLRLRMAEISNYAKSLQNSSVLVVENQEAFIEAGSVDVFRTQGGSGDESIAEVSYTLSLRVIPQILADNAIHMQIEVTNDAPTEAKGQAETSKTTRNLRTSLLRQSGETAVIGGIYSTNDIETVTGLPFISKIPVLGWLFRSRGTTKTRRELMIMVTPRVVGSVSMTRAIDDDDDDDDFEDQVSSGQSSNTGGAFQNFSNGSNFANQQANSDAFANNVGQSQQDSFDNQQQNSFDNQQQNSFDNQQQDSFDNQQQDSFDNQQQDSFNNQQQDSFDNQQQNSFDNQQNDSENNQQFNDQENDAEEDIE